METSPKGICSFAVLYRQKNKTVFATSICNDTSVIKESERGNIIGLFVS